MRKRQIPHTYVIVFFIIILAAVLTWIVPGGEYVKQTVERDGTEEIEMVFRRMESQPQTWQVLSAVFKGFVRQSGIIVFILLIGGAFWIMNQSKAIDVGIMSFLRYTSRLERIRLIRLLGVDNIIISLKSRHTLTLCKHQRSSHAKVTRGLKTHKRKNTRNNRSSMK